MPNYMTRSQYERHLEATKRCEEKLSDARKKVGVAASHGDLSENAEYDAAVEESGFLAGRLEELRSALLGVQVIDPRTTMEGVGTIGKTISLKDAQSGEEVTYHLVGAGVTDTDAGEVSYNAPLGRALIGCQKGDLVTVELPAGSKKFKVLEVGYTE